MEITDAGRPVTKPELLSPAGDSKGLRAAIVNGADAVYLGMREFNARIFAANFSLTELGQATRFSHDRGVRVYLAMNILVKNHEAGRHFDILASAYSAGIDGVIIQHVGFLEIIKKYFPGLAVFISTQAAVGNAAAASLVKSADRIILPRELSLDEIETIVRSGVGVEIFVHGALCFSYSGLCLLSSFVSNRSGNRGSCAQLCRKMYNGSYCLSTRELCLVRRIPELIEAGISGFKIEGRMRSPLYVAVATRLYRKAIDSYFTGNFVVPPKELSEIEVVFNREFTEGFSFGDRSPIAPEKPMNRGAYLGMVERGSVVLKRPVAVGDGIGVWGKRGVGGTVLRGLLVKGRPVSKASAGQRVELGVDAPEGARIYLTSTHRIRIEPEFMVSRPAIKSPERVPLQFVLPDVPPRRGQNTRILVKAYSRDEAVAAARAGADAVFYDILASDFPVEGAWTDKTLRGAYLPRILNDYEMRQALEKVHRSRPACILTGNMGLLAYREMLRIPLYLDYCLNVFNDLDVAYFRCYNATPVLSPELSLAEMNGFRDKDVVVLCHGDVVLVNTCIELSVNHLVDEKNYVFPVRKEAGYWQVINSRPLGFFNDLRQLASAGFRQFLIDKAGEGARWVSVYRDILAREIPARRLRSGYTSGHLYRPVG